MDEFVHWSHQSLPHEDLILYILTLIHIQKHRNVLKKLLFNAVWIQG